VPTPPPARDPLFGCLLWRGKLDRDGYGLRGRGPRAHVAAWLATRPPAARGLVLDHLCRRRSCVEPTHLEPVSQAENELRKRWPYRARRLRCPAGHSLATALVTPEGGRLCRTCVRGVLGGVRDACPHGRAT